MKPDEVPSLPDDWLEFYMWAVSQADDESDGAPECVLAGLDGETINRPDQP